MAGGWRIRTERGSTYVLSPGADGRVRVGRASDHLVRGTIGPLTFLEDFSRVEVVSSGGTLRLQCTAHDGTAFVTSPIRDILPDNGDGAAHTRGHRAGRTA